MHYIYPLLLVLLMGQCQQDQDTTYEHPRTYTEGIKFRQSFSLEKGETVTIYGGDVPRRLYLTLDQLSDSRCPANAVCVQYGNATVVLSAANSQGKNRNIDLCIGQCDTKPTQSSDTVTTTVGEVTYRIILKEVVPFPGLEKKGEKKVAKLIVEKV